VSIDRTEERAYALVVIDLQRDLCLDERRADLVKPAVVVINSLVEHWAKHSLPIFYTRFELPPDDPQFERFGDRYCIRGTEGAEFIDDILPLRGPVIAKRKHSAFFDTDLEEQIRGAGCDGVVLTGLQTQICILTTAADAYNRGLSVIAVEDGVISTRDEVRLEALDWIRKYVGEVTSSARLLTA
jgi:nicotinamidase-related amidase